MYLAATRSLVSKEAKQMKPWNLQLQYSGASEPRLSTMKYILDAPVSQSYKHHAKSYKVSTTNIGSLRSLPKPFWYSSVTASADTASSVSCKNGEIECSPYSVASECLGPVIDSRHWFAEESKEDDITQKVRDILKEDKHKADLNFDVYSLETLRKRIKSENQKDPNVPPGWQKKK